MSSEIKWIKIVTDIFDDEKILLIESMPDADSIIVIWLKLLLNAKKNKSGDLCYKIGSLDLTDEVLQIALKRQHPISEQLETLETMGMIRREKKAVYPVKFWEDKHDRTSERYKEWRKNVVSRDKYTCQICGCKNGLQAHHIIPWSETKHNQELRYSLSNGITLCRDCHLKAHGGKWRK